MDKTESPPPTDPCISGQVTCDRGSIWSSGERVDFLVNSAGNIRYPN